MSIEQKPERRYLSLRAQFRRDYSNEGLLMPIVIARSIWVKNADNNSLNLNSIFCSYIFQIEFIFHYILCSFQFFELLSITAGKIIMLSNFG